MEVRRLDPHDDEQWAAYHRVTAESVLSGRQYADINGPSSFRVAYVSPTSHQLQLGWCGYVNGDLVGAALAVFPMADNTHLAWTEVNVAPAHRRRGVGSALLAAMDVELNDRGRHTDQAEVARPYDESGDAVPGVAFARANGYVRAQTEVHSVLESPLPGELLDALQAEVDAYVGRYRIVSWQDRCPDEWVDAVCALEEAFMAEAPTGDLDVEPEVWSPKRLRENEARRQARGQRVLASVAVAPDGALVGNTELVVANDAVRNGIFQSGTLVLPDHRGHRLGLAMKVANQRRLQELAPMPRLVHTYNAADNAAMVAVNQRLGFRPVEYNDEWQRVRR